MANQEHLKQLKQGLGSWQTWRREHNDIHPDLSGADLAGANLAGFAASYYSVNFSGANLSGASLSGAYLHEADFSNADLTGASLSFAVPNFANFTNANLRTADLGRADLRGANFSNADLRGANLRDADLGGVNFNRADLRGATLDGSRLVRTNFKNAILTDCSVYGISAWDIQLEGAEQKNLVITPGEELTITVDNLEIAQFIHLLLNNQKIREVIDTITSKVILILGRFTDERKKVLDALRDELRKQDYLPVLFDFDKPASRDITETVSTLAHLSRFVIADITDAKSIPQELMAIVPTLPSVPVQPLLLVSQHEYGMFEHFTRFPWVLPVYHYTDEESLLHSLKAKVIEPAEQKAQELAKR